MGSYEDIYQNIDNFEKQRKEQGENDVGEEDPKKNNDDIENNSNKISDCDKTYSHNESKNSKKYKNIKPSISRHLEKQKKIRKNKKVFYNDYTNQSNNYPYRYNYNYKRPIYNNDYNNYYYNVYKTKLQDYIEYLEDKNEKLENINHIFFNAFVKKNVFDNAKSQYLDCHFNNKLLPYSTKLLSFNSKNDEFHFYEKNNCNCPFCPVNKSNYDNNKLLDIMKHEKIERTFNDYQYNKYLHNNYMNIPQKINSVEYLTNIDNNERKSRKSKSTISSLRRSKNSKKSNQNPSDFDKSFSIKIHKKDIGKLLEEMKNNNQTMSNSKLVPINPFNNTKSYSNNNQNEQTNNAEEDDGERI